MSRFNSRVAFLSAIVLSFSVPACGDDDAPVEPAPTDAESDGASDLDEADAGDAVDDGTVEDGTMEDGQVDAVDQQDLAVDTADAVPDQVETDVIDAPDQSDVPIGPPMAVLNENLTLVPDPPSSFSIEWDYPEDQPVYGFEVHVNGEPDANYGTANARTHRSMGHLPGAVVTVQVLAYNMDGSDMVFADPAVAEITIPTPDSIVVSPFVELYLAAPGTDSAAQIEALTVFLQYDDAVGFSPTVALYEGGVPVADGAVPVTFGVEEITDLLYAIPEDGVVTARAPGEMDFYVAYSWGGDAAGLVSATVHVEVVDPDAALGNIVLVWHDETEELDSIQVDINGDFRTCRADLLPCSYPVRPGRYILEFSDPDNPLSVLPIAKVVYVYSGEDTIVGYTATSRRLETNCATIVADDGGTVTSADGATLTIPAGALRVIGSRELCLMPLSPTGAPWRGRTEFGPAMLPTSYAITPEEDLFGEGSILSVPITAELEDLLTTDLGVGEVASVNITGSDWLPGPQFEIKTDTDRLEAAISTTGTYSFLTCGVFGDNEGSCRVAYGSCTADQSFEVDSFEQITCGLPASISQSPLEVVDSSDEAFSDVADVFARAYGLITAETAVCIAHPCQGTEPCVSDCLAEATLYGCGSEYSGSIDVRDGDGEWDVQLSFDIIVPTKSACEQTFSVCGDDGCWPHVAPAACSSSCLTGY